MRSCLLIMVLLFCLGAGIASPPAPKAIDADLSIPPVVQRTPVWCWLAVGEMVFEHLGVPNVNPAGVYQCGIIGAIAGPMHPCWQDCRLCNVPAGSPQGITNMLMQYPRIAGGITRQRIGGVRSTHVRQALSPEDIQEEIDNDRPIIAGISPAGVRGPFAQHVVLIVGYEESDNALFLTINDPYPYQFVGNQFDPYLRAGGAGRNGQYRISYNNFRRGLAWSESFYDLRQ